MPGVVDPVAMPWLYHCDLMAVHFLRKSELMVCHAYAGYMLILQQAPSQLELIGTLIMGSEANLNLGSYLYSGVLRLLLC